VSGRETQPPDPSDMTEHIIEYVARDRTVIHNIRSGHSGYIVRAGEWRRAPVRSLSVLGGAYLFANWDGSKRNNLHDVAFQAPTRPARPQGPGGFVAALSAALAVVFGRARSGA
jgi:hypothetical protein